MNVYLEEKDIGRKITTYHDGFGTRQERILDRIENEKKESN